MTLHRCPYPSWSGNGMEDALTVSNYIPVCCLSEGDVRKWDPHCLVLGDIVDVQEDRQTRLIKTSGPVSRRRVSAMTCGSRSVQGVKPHSRHPCLNTTALPSHQERAFHHNSRTSLAKDSRLFPLVEEEAEPVPDLTGLGLGGFGNNLNRRRPTMT